MPSSSGFRVKKAAEGSTPQALFTCVLDETLWLSEEEAINYVLEKHFGTQRSKDWFDADTFRGLARLRGMECRAPERFAEAFYMRKARLG